MVAARELQFASITLPQLRPPYEVGVDPLSGSVSLRIDLPLTQSRRGFGPALSLSPGDDELGGVLGFGIALGGLPWIGIDTRDGLPRYDGTDRFTWAGQELVPTAVDGRARWERRWGDVSYSVEAFRARVETAPVRVERWVALASGHVHFRVREADGSVGIYGARADGSTRIADRSDPERVWRFLLEARHDAFGNAWLVDYESEDDRGADADELRFAGAGPGRYVKRIVYGNREPLGEGERAEHDQFAFHVVFDYGDHGDDGLEPSRAWPVRPDPFSTGRPGFALRTRRLCRRILMFHRFPAALGEDATLVRSVELEHDGAATGSRLHAVHFLGMRHTRGRVQRRAQPVLRLRHRAYRLGSAEDEVPIAAERAFGSGTRALDLFGEGLPGLLTNAAGALLYAENLGGGRFGARRTLAERPTGVGTPFELADFDGDGNLEAVAFRGGCAGFFRLERESGSWEPFRTLPAAPRADASALRVQRVDIDGDGRADLVLLDDTGFTWFASRGEDGFAEPQHVAAPAERAPFQNLAIDRFFADMTGDGLADLVEVRNGSVRYFPNLGRGRFGDPVEMLDAPRLDHEGAFDAGRVRLVDLDGNGTADLLYLGCGELRIHRNARGARFLPEERMALPCSAELASAQVEDLLGEGTPCLVWFTRSADGSAGVRAIRLLPDGPPDLLDAIEDGLGRETRFEHRSSALEYRRDVDEGRGWSTRLPSHKQVVTRLELVDRVAGHRQGRTLRYHDGHFDGLERQFVGFLHVDEIDVLEPDLLLALEPALTRRFHHAGDDRRRGAAFLFDADPRGPPLRTGPAELTWRERDHALALRALAGRVLRTEVTTYGRSEPHVVREASMHALLLRGADAAYSRGAFRVHAQESREVTLERAPGDARVVRGLSLVHDDHGFVRMSTELARGRESGVVEGQTRDRGTARVANLAHVDTIERFELGLPIEESAYELLEPASHQTVGAMRAAARAAMEQADGTATGEGERARLLGRSRTLYWNDEQSAALPFTAVGRPALPHRQHQAAFSQAQLEGVFATLGHVDRMARDAGYEREATFWWRASPIQHFLGRAQFFALASTERLGSPARRFEYDADFLAPTAVVDELGNRTEAAVDYHLLAPWRIEDANGFTREVEYDALGVIIRATARGSVRGEGRTSDYGHAALAETALPSIATALADPEAALGGVQHLYLYDFGDPAAAQAPRALRLTAERFAGDEPRAQVELGYLDGFGRSLQEKTRVEPGPAIVRAADGSLELTAGVPVPRETDVRWRVSGFRSYDDRGQLLREHEPFFSARAELELDAELRRFGSATTVRHDALGRSMREEYADGSFSRVSFEPWRVQRFDANDTVHEDGAAGYRRAREGLASDDPRRLALDRAMEHRDTPTTSYLDPFGREIVTEELADDRRPLRSRADLDGRGDPIRLVDPRGIVSFSYERDLLGRVLREQSADAGERLTFPDAFDRPVRERNARGVLREQRWDALDRPTESYIEHGGRRWLAARSEYGESAPDGRARNARGRLLRHHDPAGVVEVGDYDPFGNVLARSRRPTETIVDPDWDGDVALDAPHESRFSYDALGRVLLQRLPDGVERRTRYLRGSGIESITATADGREHPILTGAQFNARGQRIDLRLGNDVQVESEHDPETFRLQRLFAVRRRGDRRELLSSAHHTYDPAGHLVHFLDEGQEPGRSLVMAGQQVSSRRTFRYDFRYQLTEATGRVHRALGIFTSPEATADGDLRGPERLSLRDGGQIARYVRFHRYDDGGNLTHIDHRPEPGQPGPRFTVDKWISDRSNRSLLRFDAHGLEIPDPESRFDPNGNTLEVQGVQRIEWDVHDRLARAVIIERPGGTDDDERYQYGSDSKRVRKLRRRLDHGQIVTIETLYLDGCELRRMWRGDRLILQRFVSHFEDEDGSKLATLHRWERDDSHLETDHPDSARVHFVLNDSRGSAVLELNADADVLAYEEYFPYGGTAFVAGDIREVALRTIRYSGKERDDVMGLYCFQYRYYSPHLGNWLSPDPIGPEDGFNGYQYVHGDPVNLSDDNGLLTYSQRHDDVEPHLRQAPDADVETVPSREESGVPLLPAPTPPSRGEADSHSHPRVRPSSSEPRLTTDGSTEVPDPLDFPSSTGQPVAVPGNGGPAGGEPDPEADTSQVPVAPLPPPPRVCDPVRDELGLCEPIPEDSTQQTGPDASPGIGIGEEEPVIADRLDIELGGERYQIPLSEDPEIRDAQRRFWEQAEENDAADRAGREAVGSAFLDAITAGMWSRQQEADRQLAEGDVHGAFEALHPDPVTQAYEAVTGVVALTLSIGEYIAQQDTDYLQARSGGAIDIDGALHPELRSRDREERLTAHRQRGVREALLYTLGAGAAGGLAVGIVGETVIPAEASSFPADRRVARADRTLRHAGTSPGRVSVPGRGGSWLGLGHNERTERFSLDLVMENDVVELPRGALSRSDLGVLSSAERSEFMILRVLDPDGFSRWVGRRFEAGARVILRSGTEGGVVPPGVLVILHTHSGRGPGIGQLGSGLFPGMDDWGTLAELRRRGYQESSAIVNETGHAIIYGY
jgi:RHS repeat-associated protein